MWFPWALPSHHRPLPTPHWLQLRGPPFSPLATKHLPASGTPHWLFQRASRPQSSLSLSGLLLNQSILRGAFQSSPSHVPFPISFLSAFHSYLSNSLSCGCLLLWKLQGGTQVLLQFVPSVPRAQHSAWSRPPHSVLVPLTMDTSPLSGGGVSSQLGHVADHPEAVRGMTASQSPQKDPGRGLGWHPPMIWSWGSGGQTCLVQLGQEAQEDGAGVQRQLLLQELG